MVRAAPVPAASLLQRCGDAGAYVDCWVADVGFAATHADFVAAFYTTWLFRLERLLLRWLVAKPSTDADAHTVANGRSDTFAAWRVEARAVDELLLADYTGRTKSWFRVEPLESGAGTRLFFGSAVVPLARDGGKPRMGFPFDALLGFHRLYSWSLLTAARSRLRRGAAR